MKFLVKEKFLSLWGEFMITDENEQPAFKVKGNASMAGNFCLMDLNGQELGSVKGKAMSMMPKFLVTIDGKERGVIKQKVTLSKPKFIFESKGWTVQGNVLELDYVIKDQNKRVVAEIRQKMLHLHDTYQVEVFEEADVVPVLLMVMAIDEAKDTETAAVASMFM